MKGMFGAGLIALGIFVAVIGGFLFNAETVTTCSTDWEYVTDIAAAFQGEKSDLDVDYDPASNVTGWSDVQGYNNGLVAGVDYLQSSPNTYFVVLDSPPGGEDTITLRSGATSAWSAQSEVEGSLLSGATATEIWHVQRPGAWEPSTTDRVLEIPLAAIMTAYNADQYALITITMDPTYPAWPGVFFDSDMRYHYAAAGHQGYYSWEGQPVTSMDVFPQSATVRIGGTVYQLSDIHFGLKSSQTLELSVVRTQLTPVVYMDPVAGVLPIWDTSTLYWSNGYQNVSVTMAFSRYDLEGNLHEGETIIRPLDMSGDGDVRMGVTVHSGRWSMVLYEYDPEGDIHWQASETVDLGAWDAVQLTFSQGSVTAMPIGSFRTFGDYVTVNTPVTKDWDLAGGGTIGSIEFPESPVLRMCAVSTTVRIPDGGLYMQNASLTPSDAFPTVQAVSLRIGSAAHVGTGIVFSDGNSSVLVPVRENNQMRIDGRWLDFKDVTFMWVSTSMPAKTIAGTTYPAGLYQKGQSYAAGTVWAMTPSGAKEIIQSSDWTVLLEGVWAPSVLFYTGDNVVDERTELYDISEPSFRWDKATFVVILMAVSVCGAVIGSYFEKTDVLDWVVVGGTIAVLWVML